MRPLVVITLLLLPACADETTTTGFGAGGGGGGGDTSSSGGPRTTGDERPTTTGEPAPTTGVPATSGEVELETGAGGSTGTSSSSSSDDGSTSTGAVDESSAGESTSTGVAGSTSTGESAPACDDAVMNQDETDIDCGGAVCGACGLAGACVSDGDCGSGWCAAQVCAQPGCLVDADCDALTGACVAASCDLAEKTCVLVAVNQGQPCDDDNSCTTGETCDAAVCLGGALADCSALDNLCGVGVCDPQSGLCGTQGPDKEGQPCDDGHVCTPDDVCTGGICGVGGPGFLFFEDFSSPDPGWELGPTWELGHAVPSPSGWNGADPADDHSEGKDAGIAGTVIGGLVPTGALAKTCLTSPVIDASGPGALLLSFWRHLHTDGFPFAAHHIEAFDGAQWQSVEVGYGGSGVDDPAWTLMEYDLGAYKNPQLRVRICHAQTGSAFQAAGWSVDDLTVGPYICIPEQ